MTILFEFESWRSRSEVVVGDESFYTLPSGSVLERARAIRECIINPTFSFKN